MSINYRATTHTIKIEGRKFGVTASTNELGSRLLGMREATNP